jgi:hypothetical protein
MTISRIFTIPSQRSDSCSVRSSSLEPRARAARSKSAPWRIRLYVADKLNRGCEVEEPKDPPKHQRELQQDYFSALSREQIDPFDVMAKLVKLSHRLSHKYANESKLKDGQEKLDEFQIYRLAKNFRSFSQLKFAVMKTILEIRQSGEWSGSKRKFLILLETIDANIEATGDLIKALADGKGIKVDVQSARPSTEDLNSFKHALSEAWNEIRLGAKEPADVLLPKIDIAKEDRTKSNKDRRILRDGRALKEIYRRFRRRGTFDPDILKPLLEQALRRTGFQDRAARNARAQEVIDGLTSEERTAVQGEMLYSLLLAMLDQRTGAEGAGDRLDEAIEAILDHGRKRGPEFEYDLENSEEEEVEHYDPKPALITHEPPGRNLANLTDPDDLRHAIHDIAQHISREVAGVGESTYKVLVRGELLKEKFTEEDARRVLKRAKAIDFEGRSKIVREVLKDLVDEMASRARKFRHESMIGMDPEIYDATLKTYFRTYVDRVNSGEDVDADTEIEEYLAQLPFEANLTICSFFSRHHWITDYFEKRQTETDQEFSRIALAFETFSLWTLQSKYKYIPDIKPLDSNEQIRRFENIAKANPGWTVFDIFEEYFNKYSNGTGSLVEQLAELPPPSRFEASGDTQRTRTTPEDSDRATDDLLTNLSDLPREGVRSRALRRQKARPRHQ